MLQANALDEVKKTIVEKILINNSFIISP